MERRRILLCAGTGCISSGSLGVKEALLKELEKRGIADQYEVVTRLPRFLRAGQLSLCIRRYFLLPRASGRCSGIGGRISAQ